MSDATLGDYALEALVSIIAGGGTGLLTFLTAFKNEKQRIYDAADNEKVELNKRLTLFEQRLYDRVAACERAVDLLSDKMSDSVHDLEKMDTAHGLQLAMLTTTTAHIEVSIGEIKGLIQNSDHRNGALLEQLLTALSRKGIKHDNNS